MLLYVMRHGIAHDRLDPACPPDPLRALTDDGVRKTAAAARGLAWFRPTIDTVITSPYLRARQTAQLACEALAIPQRDMVESDALTPGVDGAASAEALSEIVPSSAEGVLVAGHAPNLDLLVSYLVAGAGDERVLLKKAAVALVELEHGWGAGRGTLLWLLPPKVLRRLGGA